MGGDVWLMVLTQVHVARVDHFQSPAIHHRSPTCMIYHVNWSKRCSSKTVHGYVFGVLFFINAYLFVLAVLAVCCCILVTTHITRSHTQVQQQQRRMLHLKPRTSKFFGVGATNRKNQWQARIIVDQKVCGEGGNGCVSCCA